MVMEVREKDACWASDLCNWVDFSVVHGERNPGGGTGFKRNSRISNMRG